MLRHYDTLIIDEAHERSLNIDFLLGLPQAALPRRPDLKVIITSATIDPDRFARHFADARRGGAPVIEVSGRTYPVEVRYRPLVELAEDDEDGDGDEETSATRPRRSATPSTSWPPRARATSWCSSAASGRSATPPTRCASWRRPARCAAPRSCRCTPGCPRPSSTGSSQPHPGRRVVLATNVAETSLTVPGIRYVIDPGTARISRYSHRLKVQRLPIEPISQASANQRKGRCGRIRTASASASTTRRTSSPGRSSPTRRSCAPTCLGHPADDRAGLGDMAAFPFLDPPDRRNIARRRRLLEELGALDPTEADQAQRLTKLGRQLAQLPVDPRLGRMVLEAERNGCAREVMVIAAALSIQDPRERPAEQAGGGRRRCTPGSPTRTPTSSPPQPLGLPARAAAGAVLQRVPPDVQGASSSTTCGSANGRTCTASCARCRPARLGLRPARDTSRRTPAGARPVHGPRTRSTPRSQSLLAGLLSHIGLRGRRQKRGYLGARGARFAIFPGSALFKKPPRWVMAAELVETSRLWARIAARIEPEWVEPLAAAPGQAHLQRAALGEEAGRGDGATRRSPCTACRSSPPRRSTTGGSTPSCPGSCSSGTRWSRATGRPTTSSSHDNQRAARRGRGAGAPGPPPRHPGRRRDALRLLRPADPGRRRLRPALRQLVEAGRAHAARPADFTRDDAGQRRRGRGRPADYPDAGRATGSLPLTYQFEPGRRPTA